MIWFPMLGLAVGALLAQRFKIVALFPATVAIAILAFAVAASRTSSVLATTLIIGTTSICMQAGYFVGMLLRCGAGGASRLFSFFPTKSARDRAR